MAAGDVKQLYATTVAVTQTSLDGLATSTTHLVGWAGVAIDNTTNQYTDYKITAKIQVESTGVTAGEIRLYIVPEMNDTTFPDGFTGTEGTKTVTDTEVRDAICHLIAMSVTDTTASRVYYLSCPSLLRALGNVPRKFIPFITQSASGTLETTADPNQVYVQGIYYQVAQA